MSRKASKITLMEVPETLPAGLETVECNRTVSEGSGDSKTETKGAVTFLVPENSAAGVRAYVKFLSAARPGEDGEPSQYGAEFVAASIRSAIVGNVSARLTPSTLETSQSMLPTVSDIRTVDKAAAAGDKMANFVRDNGRMPNAEEMATLFAGLIG